MGAREKLSYGLCVLRFGALLANDYAGFADRTLANREMFGLPPASRMALVRAEAKDAEAVSEFFTRAHGVLRGALSTRDGEVFAPQPPPSPARPTSPAGR